ncbi:MAG TPA: AEC family transporter [Solirubrobacteraceae bacterium]|nr:AEC family transporter [Solirubrobacteraceae bacterium]
MLLVALAIGASTGAGLWAERRWGERAQAASRASIGVLLWAVLPFITFFTLARLEVTTGVGAGLGLAYLELAIVGVAAWAVGARLLGLSRPSTGALVVVVVMANTGYLGVPLNGALLGRDDLAPAIAFDTVVSGPMFYVVGFAVGAVFGAAAGETPRERLRAFLARNPPLLAVVAALLAPDALAPDALVDVATVLVYAVLPVGFFVLGVNLAAEAEEGALPFPPPFGAPVGVALALRLLAAPALLLAFSAAVVRLPDAYLVQAAMPSGINSLVVAHAYGLDLRLTAAVLAWSTGIVVAAALAAAALL